MSDEEWLYVVLAAKEDDGDNEGHRFCVTDGPNETDEVLFHGPGQEAEDELCRLINEWSVTPKPT